METMDVATALGLEEWEGRPAPQEGPEPATDADSFELPRAAIGNHVALGRCGEDVAAEFLVRRGFEILERNWSCAGREADIIARDEEDGSLHFVEVKTRISTRCGFPCEAVDSRKRRRYEALAECYLSGYDGPDAAVSFDVISILVLNGTHGFLCFYRNAFSRDW